MPDSTILILPHMQISTYHAFFALFGCVFREPPPEHFLIIIAVLPADFLAITNNQEGRSSDNRLLQNDTLGYWPSYIYPSERECLRIGRFFIDRANIVFPRLAERTIVGSDHNKACPSRSDGRIQGQEKYYDGD